MGSKKKSKMYEKFYGEPYKPKGKEQKGKTRE